MTGLAWSQSVAEWEVATAARAAAMESVSTALQSNEAVVGWLLRIARAIVEVDRATGVIVEAATELRRAADSGNAGRRAQRLTAFQAASQLWDLAERDVMHLINGFERVAQGADASDRHRQLAAPFARSVTATRRLIREALAAQQIHAGEALSKRLVDHPPLPGRRVQ